MIQSYTFTTKVLLYHENTLSAKQDNKITKTVYSGKENTKKKKRKEIKDISTLQPTSTPHTHSI